MTNHYELLYLVSANCTEDELVPIKEKIKQLIAKFEGEITGEDTLGKKKLAYPIEGSYQGYYLIYKFYLAGQNLKDLNNNLKLTNELLRHIIVRKKFQTPEMKKAAEKRIEPMEAQKAEAIREKKEEKDKDKIKLEDLDKKLDEILEGDII